MAKKTVETCNVVPFRARKASGAIRRPYLAEEDDERLGELAAAELRVALGRQIETGSLRWARNGRLLPVGERPEASDSYVFSASEACARIALQEAIRALFWECGEPIPKTDIPERILRLQEEFGDGLRRVLRDLGHG